MEVKNCSFCNKEKTLSEFRKIRGVYHRNKCSDCESEYHKEYVNENKSDISDSKQRYYYKNKEKINVKLKERHRKDPRINMLYTAKHRAKKSGVPFELTIDDFTIPEFCPILKVKLIIGEGTSCECSPSLDKIKPEIGYVKGNVQVISRKANSMKYNANEKELLLFAEWVLKFLKEKTDE